MECSVLRFLFLFFFFKVIFRNVLPVGDVPFFAWGIGLVLMAPCSFMLWLRPH